MKFILFYTLLVLYVTLSCQSKKSLKEKKIDQAFPIEKKEVFRGLVNCGNSCYINSILQNFLHMDGFIDFFLNYEETEFSGETTKKLSRLFKGYYNLESKDPYNPEDLISHIWDSLGNEGELFLARSQDDAANFMSYLIGRLREENNLSLEDVKKQNIFSHKKFGKYSKRLYTPKFYFGDAILSGLKRTITRCYLNNYMVFEKTGSYELSEEFRLLTDEEDENKLISINELLKNLSQTETRNELRCQEETYTDNNGTIQYRDAIEKDSVEVTPQYLFLPGELSKQDGYLFIILPRFKQDFDPLRMTVIPRKTNYPIDVNETIKLKSINKEKIYTFSGMVLHSGTLESGHYTAIVKSFNEDKFYHLNDSRVNLIKKEEVFKNNQRNAYILFYKEI
ncbi:MAG: hypothetical protein CMP11_01225 [Zetaproteobacteria bacterium]|nr:hypothetical protein [Pseudobdellovibrionaceae bacterium]|tara:strand:- start:97 stop:1278 length:1182 start_codon:yes stop_codon:yes gene_type:complete